MRALEGLDLALLVYTEHHGFVRRIEIQTHDVANLFDEERIVGKLERAAAMGLDPEQREVAVDRAFGESSLAGKGARTPMRGILRPLVECSLDELCDLVVPIGPRSTCAGLVIEPDRPLRRIAATPLVSLSAS